MSLLYDTAETLKANDVPIERWVTDPGSEKRIGFRATIDHQRFWVSARSRIPEDGDVGVMERLVRTAANDTNALLYIRLGNAPFRRGYVLDPDAYLEYGERNTADGGRRQRGERWLNLPTSWACRLNDFVDGRNAPRTEPTEQEKKVPDGGWFQMGDN